MIDTPELRKQLTALNNGDDSVKRQAIQSLRHHTVQEWEAVPAELSQALVKALSELLLHGSKQPSALKEVIIILGNIGLPAKTVVPQLIELLQDGVPDLVREASATALGKIGKDAKAAVDQLVHVLEKSRPALTGHVVRALGNLGCADSRVRTALLNLWLSPVQIQIATTQVAIALCKLHIQADKLLETLTRTLVTNQEISFRKAAAEALSWCNKNDLDVVPALLTASLGDTNDDVRQLAKSGLDQMRLTPEKAIRLCSQQLEESNYAENALRKSGEPAVQALIEALGTKNPAVRIKAARTLGCFGEAAAKAAPALISTLQDADRDVRLAAAKGLWNVTKTADQVVPTLVDLIQGKGSPKSEDSETRRRFLQTVMEALSRMGPSATSASPALTPLTRDSNNHIRDAALLTLEKIRPPVAQKASAKR